MSKKKIVRNLIFVVAILILLVVLVINLGDIKEIWSVLTNSKIGYIFLAIGAVLLYAFTYQLSLMILTKYRFKEIKFIDLFAISGTEFFFNAITPFSSGGQPFQAYALKRKKMKLADSTSALLINFIAYQVCLNIIAVVFLIIYYNKVYNQIDAFIAFLIVGFTINMLIMVGLILIGTVKPVGKIFLKLFHLITRIKFLRRFESGEAAFAEYINNMQIAFKEISKKPLLWFLILITKIISFGFYYAIPYIALYAIGVHIKAIDLPYTLALTAFTLTIAIWVPTPGGSGGVEYAFKELYSPFLETYGYDSSTSVSMAFAVMMIWRLLTYYFLMFYGFVLYLIFEKRCKTNDKSIDTTDNDETRNNIVQETEINDIIEE